MRGRMKRNGTTKAGTKRWRCTRCGASSVRKMDSSAKALSSLLSWLMSKSSIAEPGTSRATFWRKTAWIWRIWPIAPYTGEVFDVVFLDGIWMGRKAVVLIAYADGHVVAWHLAQSECTSAWAALMTRMPAPSMAVSDGARGLAKAASIAWPATRIQRCIFHVASQVRRCTTLNPNLEAGREPLGIANTLKEARDAESAADWLASCSDWRAKWEGFLREFTLKEGRKQHVHERLRKARRGLNKLVREGALLTFVEMGARRGMPRDQQRDREHERPDKGDAQDPSRDAPAAPHQGRLLVMLRAHRGSSAFC